MSSLDDVLAKSPKRDGAGGERLTDHLAATLTAARELQDRVGRLDAVPETFWDWVAWATLTHDAGKIASGFQEMVSASRGKSAPWGQRHEVLSLGFLPRLLAELPATEQLWVAVGVLTHHRPLTAGGSPGQGKPPLAAQYGPMPAEEFAEELGPVDSERVSTLASWLAERAARAGLPNPPQPTHAEGSDLVADAHGLLGDVLERWEWGVPEAEGLCAVLLQGAVTLADHLSSAHGTLHTRPPLDASYRARLEARLAAMGGQLRPHQREAASVDGHLLLRAPTGSGKTEAAELWAATQVESLRASVGGTPRVFVTLPYLASINAMADRLRDELGAADGVGVAHSRAASYHLARSLSDDTGSEGSTAGKALSRATATRLFREALRVATPYQLLRGSLAGPAHAGILIDSANSVFVLDELHAYDPRRLGMILAAIAFWERLGGRVAVTSATLPEALAELLRDTLSRPVRTVEPGGMWPARHRLHVSGDRLTGPEPLAAIRRHLAEEQSVLVVANNVRDAREIYAALRPYVTERFGADACLLLHSRFRRKDRSRIEQGLVTRFGTEQPRQPGLLVATQVVEVSLDVDLDVLYTSGAPLEALLQRFGRANRLGKRPPADVVVHAPQYGSRRGERGEYADGVYEAEPTTLAWQILSENDGRDVNEREIVDWLDRVYASEWGRRWRHRVDEVRADFTRYFLTFTEPFADRSDLADAFDELFEGAEAVLADDIDTYREALLDAGGARGRLLAEEYLVPLPLYATRLARWDRELSVRVIDADYDQETGLGSPRAPEVIPGYSPGEIL